MSAPVILKYSVPGDDFTRAGEASSAVKKALKKLGVAPDVIRKVAIAMYEGEINMVIHADGGEITVEITPEYVNIDLAMKEGYSTAPDNVRSLGFGAGMGLPNMKKYTDEMKVESQVGVGTTVTMRVYVQP